MARPKSLTPRTRQVSLSLTAEEAETLERRADAAGKRPAVYVREQLLDGEAKGTAVLPAKFDALVYEQVRRIGVNLNQIARQMNALGRTSMAELDAALREVREFLRRMG